MGDVEAGCNGSCDVINGEDWNVELDTHIWDEEIEVKNLEVLNGASLKLENVSVEINNHVSIRGYTEWIDSNVSLIQSERTDNVSLYSNLIISGSEVNIYFDRSSSEVFLDDGLAEGFYLHEGSKLIIKDIDNDANTEADSSILKPVGYNECYTSYACYETWEILTENSTNTELLITNSILIDNFQSKIYSDNVTFENNKLYGHRDFYLYGNNLTYKNNYHNATELNSSRSDVGGPRFSGDNATFSKNVFLEGNNGVLIDGGSNVTLINNTFYRTTTAIWFDSLSNDIYINENIFDDMNSVWYGDDVINVIFSNNVVSNCSWNSATWASGGNISLYENEFKHCGGSCIMIAGNQYDHKDIFIYDNYFHNYSGIGIRLASHNQILENVKIFNNTFSNGGSGVTGSEWINLASLPHNVEIKSNRFTSLTYGIQLTMQGGSDFIIHNNSIVNTSYGIKISGTLKSMKNLTIQHNDIESNFNSILYTCQPLDSLLRNNIIQHNTLLSDSETISMDTCDGDVLFFNNTIYSSKTAIDLYDSEADIISNIIISTCESEDCLKVSFNKVAEKGIKLSKESTAKIESNDISNFYHSIHIVDSFNNIINDNKINFTYTGIHNEGSVTSISNNYINNSYVGINIEHSVVEIKSGQFDTFDIGIESFNSTVLIDQMYLNEGDLCMNFVDTNYTIYNYQNLNCIESILYEKYYFNVKIETNDGFPSPQHPFQYNTNLQQGNGITNYTGISDYYLITTKKIDNAGFTTIFNPVTISYRHNSIESHIVLAIYYNQTIVAELDTVAPVTELKVNNSIINSLDLYLNFNKISVKNDLLEYDVYSLTNDGINFAEWEYVGTYNDTWIHFEAENGFKYRFKSLSRDIYGNIEVKEGYDCEVEIDIEDPVSFFDSISSNYYFAKENEVLIKVESNDNDVEIYEIVIEYTNFTTSYLNPSSVVWNTVDKQFFYSKEEFVYQLSSEGHYGFNILATDIAGNKEQKEDYDFIINYDPNSDTLSFTDLPERWGSEDLEINLANSDFNLDFNLYLAMESLNYENPYFTWYEHPTSTNNEIITIQGLLDKTRYYLYAESIDLAGNIEDPLNTTEYFSSSGQYDQIFTIKYIPLLMESYGFTVEIDNNLDGIYETKLALGEDLDKLEPNEFFVDKSNKTLHFGGVINGGFVPNQDLNKINNIKVNYSGVHAIFEVYTGNPQSAQNLEIIPTNITHIVFEFNVPSDSDNCKVQRTTNLSKGWFNQEILSPCLKGTYEYEHLNPEPNSKYFYRVMIEDEFGHLSVSENRSVDMTDVVKIYSSDNAAQSDQSIDTVILLTATVGALMLGFGGVLLYRTKNSDKLDDRANVIESKPVAKYKVEELYLIYKDGRLIRNISAVQTKTDSDIMSGMLTAINDFVQDSFNTEGDLGDIGYGNNKIILQRGNNSYLAAVIYGEVDNYFKGKLINAVRSIESKNPNMDNWNGDSESISKVKISLKPIIDETSSVTREMVDNYFTEKDLVITTNSEKMGDIINLKVNISNYSSSIIQNCKIKPEINSSILSIIGIEPDLAYHFKENYFNLGEIDSYKEVYLEIKLRAKKSEDTAVEIKMNYKMKDKEGDLSSVIQIN